MPTPLTRDQGGNRLATKQGWKEIQRVVEEGLPSGDGLYLPSVKTIVAVLAQEALKGISNQKMAVDRALLKGGVANDHTVNREAYTAFANKLWPQLHQGSRKSELEFLAKTDQPAQPN